MDLNVRNKTVKHFEKNIGVNLCALGLDNYFSYMTLKVQATTKTLINWLHYN